jgi:hypothetical protein
VLTYFRNRILQRPGALAGLLCILLLLVGTTIQVSHGHLPHDGHPDNHANCSLCVTAHATVQVVILPVGFVAPVVTPERRIYSPRRAIPTRVWAHPLWNRPPPSTTLPAAASSFA